jgi:phosphatidylserine decarboxylase
MATVIRACHRHRTPLRDRVAYSHSCCLSSFVTVSVLRTRFQTPVCKRTLSPVYAAKDATFDFPIYMSLADRLGVLEFVIWDKDMLKKEYMGEHALQLDEWFKGTAFAFDDPDNQVRRSLLGGHQSRKQTCFTVFLC